MSKYSKLFKTTIAQQCIDGLSSRELGRLFNVSSRQVRYWRQVYLINHDRSFLPPCNPYTVEDKLKILTRMRTEGWSLTHASAFYNLSSPGNLHVWLRNYELHGVDGLRPKKSGKSLMKQTQPPVSTKPASAMTAQELIDELEYLRAENAVLKKFDALLQEKKLRAKKKLK